MSKTYIPVFWDIETTGLNPMAQSWHSHTEHDAAVTAVAIGTFDGWREPEPDPEYNVRILMNENNEYSMSGEYKLFNRLNGLMRGMIAEHEDGESELFFVGYNSRRFDHPYIGARMARLRKNGFPLTHGRKRLDMMAAIKSRDGRYVSQDDYAEELGVEHEPFLTGKDMPEAFSTGNFEAIRGHVEADIRVLMEMFLKDRTDMMNHFYAHYDIDQTANYDPEVEL